MRLLSAVQGSVFLLLAAVAMVVALQTDAPWAGVGFVLLFGARGVRSLVVFRGTGPTVRADDLTKRRTWRPVVLAYLAAAGAFLVSVVLGESRWSLLGVVLGVGLGLLFHFMGRDGREASSAG